MNACDVCLRRTDLIAALAGWIEIEWRKGERRSQLLAIPDEVLLATAHPHVADVWLRYETFDPDEARLVAERAQLTQICRCDPVYPAVLEDLDEPPAVLHVRGDPAALHHPDAVAIVGARRATETGLEVARSLGRDLAAAGVPVISGLALGVDSAAHTGALEAAAPVVAVLANGADQPYPRSKRWLYEKVAARGAVVSELPPGAPVHRWAFPARNRLIAALSCFTVVVEATERSGSLLTADFALHLGRAVGAVPGRVTVRQSEGANALLAAGAHVVRHAQDVLDALGQQGFAHELVAHDRRPEEPDLRDLLDRIAAGHDSLAELVGADGRVDDVLRNLTELEVRGLVRRVFGGRYVAAL